MYCILVIGPRVTVIRPKLNLVPALGIVGLFNVRSGTFHCLSIQKLTDTFCSPCALKITPVVPVCVMVENCIHLGVPTMISRSLRFNLLSSDSGYIYRSSTLHAQIHNVESCTRRKYRLYGATMRHRSDSVYSSTYLIIYIRQLTVL